MAARQHQQRNQTWLDYYRTVGEGLEEEEAAVSPNAISIEYLNSEEKLLNAVLEHPRYNVLLVPSTKRGSLHVLHHCSVYEDETSGKQLVIGVNGTRFASPWRVLLTAKAIAPLKPPGKRKQAGLLMPSTSQFLQIEDVHDFSELKGKDERSELNLLKSIPNVHWIAPRLFVECLDSRSIDARELAFRIITDIKRVTPVTELV